MNKNLLKSARVKCGMTQSDAALVIEKSVDAYAKKERGEVYFTPAEISALTVAFHLTLEECNDIFFDSKLLFSK